MIPFSGATIIGDAMPEFDGGYDFPPDVPAGIFSESSVIPTIVDMLRGAYFPFTSAFWVDQGLQVILSFCILVIGYFAFRRFADPGQDSRRAWIPSVVSSGILSVLCTPLSVIWLKSLWKRGPEEGGDLLLGGNAFEQFTMVFFYTFMCFDLILSSFRFPGHMELCTGYVHHIVYMILVGNSLKWNFTRGVAIMFCEEIPTFILGMGMVNPNIKSEGLFGGTFFALRIVFHTLVTVIATIQIRDRTNLWIAGYLALALHCWWFLGWIRRQSRLQKRRRLTDVDSLENVEDDGRNDFESRGNRLPIKLDTMLTMQDEDATALGRLLDV